MIPPEQAHTSLNSISLSDSSILLPFDSDLVFLDTELHCCSSTTNDALKTDAQLLRQHLLKEFHDVFESQPPMKGEQFNIVLKENAVPCCVSKARPILIAYQQALRNELDELLGEGIINSVTETTEWVNPIVVEPKRDRNGKYNGKIRLCVDFQHLNKYCVRERYQSPSVLKVVQNIEADHASLFSPFDARKGYHQIKLAQESKNLTTFLTPFGRFCYECAPFGIDSIKEHYNRRMSEELHELPNITKVVDNNIVYSANDLTTHATFVCKFLTRCGERGIRLLRDKFVFAKSKILLLELSSVIVATQFKIKY